MTLYLDVRTVSALIQKMGLEKSLTGLSRYITDDYKRWSAFEKSARLASHFPFGVIELMPISDQTLYAFKYVNGHPHNTHKNLSTVMAFGVLAEAETGLPLLLTEMTLMTALRTAAISVVVAKECARKNSQKMAVIGAGAQSEFQILAFKSILGIKEFSLYDTDPEAIRKLHHNLDGDKEIKIMTAASISEALKGADIITTITADKTRAAILTHDMIAQGVHINAVGGDCPGKTELHPGVLKDARVIVEYEPQTRIEGDIQQMPPDFPVIEFWKILTQKEPGRQNDKQVTVFDSVGFALEDFSSMRYLYDLAREQKVGTPTDLIPTLPNPKDLYSLLHTLPLSMPLASKVAEKVERK